MTRPQTQALPVPPAGDRGVKAVCVCGPKKSGKTTLVVSLVRHLTALGLSVGTIKHDGHDFDLDRPETDSWKHKAAGAKAAAVFSSHRWAFFRDGEPELETLLALMADLDLILVEGLKGSAWPKIVLYGDDGSTPQAAEPILAVVGRAPPELPHPRYDRDDVAGIARAILETLRKR